MTDIELLACPLGHWMMLCPCGSTELRSSPGLVWTAFDLRPLADSRYRITCDQCGNSTETCHHVDAIGEHDAVSR
ncbi:hypothetical protein ACFPTY_09840 [Halomonas beimenensis]|uniref:Uncharacterized protein n=1 Tax=Halomonas beimenensis TaxID=475662 RepID=A0A291P8R6_9GAMM|nr:hypothetical protein [Halomonas beimenensis]ATJ83306.1 hypothetical protein BEI_2319 [Halomonas beimenensis]